jgi:hypothetical protein
VPVEETLRRAAADLDAGRVTLARQRLRGLVGSFPARVDVRELLAETYRRDHDNAQAGRWSYLSPEPDPEEIAAFERMYADPFARMRALHWRGPEDHAGPVGAARLRALRAQAEAISGASIAWETARRPDPPRTLEDRIVELGCAAIASTLIVLVLAGVIALAIIGAHALARWLS